MSGKLVVEPFGGLGNRMRVLVSAVNLAEQLDKKLQIVWRRGDDFNASYERLYQPTDYFEITSPKNSPVYSSFNTNRVKQILINVKNQLNGFHLVIGEQDHVRVFKEKADIVSLLKEYQNIYIRSCEQFFGGNKWEIFTPTAPLNLRIKSITDQYDTSTIGVHIRRTDNGKSIHVSTHKAFVQLMQFELIQNASTTFFICTDDHDALQEIKQTFDPSRLIIYKKEFSRSKEKGIEDALIEMHALSRCRKIFGSYWSSFSEVASFLKGAPLTIATADLVVD